MEIGLHARPEKCLTGSRLDEWDAASCTWVAVLGSKDGVSRHGTDGILGLFIAQASCWGFSFFRNRVEGHCLQGFGFPLALVVGCARVEFCCSSIRFQTRMT